MLKTASILRICTAAFGVLILVSSALGLTSADADKALVGAIVYQLNMMNAGFLFFVVKDYLSFGVRKVLKSGKVASFGAATTAKTIGATAVTAVTSTE